jgi:hypothetical protein
MARTLTVLRHVGFFVAICDVHQHPGNGTCWSGLEGDLAMLQAATVLFEPSKSDPIESRGTLRSVEIMQEKNRGQSISLWTATSPGPNQSTLVEDNLICEQRRKQ